MNVGIRDLKAHLSEYVARAAAGDEIVVTDRARPVARIVPFAGESAIDRGIDEGWIEAPRRARLDPVARQATTASTGDVLDEDRG
jgi:prevent-host-death family protein